MDRRNIRVDELMKCIRCGDCCEFLALGVTLMQILVSDDLPDKDFIIEHFRQVERPKEKPNPQMSDNAFKGLVFYKCDLFDPTTRKCLDYENRPQICREYPGNRKPQDLISARCDYATGGFRHWTL